MVGTETALIDPEKLQEVVRGIQHDSAEQELKWMVHKIMEPEMRQIAEALETCSSLIVHNRASRFDGEKEEDGHDGRDQEYKEEKGPKDSKAEGVKLPFSSSKTEVLKGVMVRDGVMVTLMWLRLHDDYFNKVTSTLRMVRPIVLPQLQAADECISRALEIIRLTDGYIHQDTSSVYESLMAAFRQLLQEVRTAKTNLQMPVDPELVFPKNVTPQDSFEPPLTDHIAIDFYISQAELCIDMKYLQIIREKPWCEIDEHGQSYVDKLREQMKLPSLAGLPKPSGPLPHPLNLSDVDNKLKEAAKEMQSSENLNAMKNFFTHFLIKPKQPPSEYITRCITYDNKVVMVRRKVEVSSPDPVLVSALSKLGSIEYLIERFLDNLQSIYNAL